MSVHQIKCPKCQSGTCAPTFYTAHSIQCIPCGHEFDLRGGFWSRLWATITGTRYGGFHS